MIPHFLITNRCMWDILLLLGGQGDSKCILGVFFFFMLLM